MPRLWKNGDVVELELPMEVQRLQANPQVVEDRGKVALRHGPLIYCLEQTDQPRDLDEIVLPRSAKLESRFEPKLLNGVVLITGEGRSIKSSNWGDHLYRPLAAERSEAVLIRAVPYFAWANRNQGKMTVWIPSD